MKRERPGSVGVTWQQGPSRVEVVADEDGKPLGLNREQRRALERARRQRGGKR